MTAAAIAAVILSAVLSLLFKLFKPFTNSVCKRELAVLADKDRLKGELSRFVESESLVLADYEKSSRSRQSNTRQIAHAIALAVSQLPDRIRDALQGKLTDDASAPEEVFASGESEETIEAVTEEAADAESSDENSEE